MSVPGVGPLVAITFKTAIDDPGRGIRKVQKLSAPCSGLTPRKYQSGETDVTGGVSASATRWRVPRFMKRPTPYCRASRVSRR